MEGAVFLAVLVILFLIGIAIPYALGIATIVAMAITGTGEIAFNTLTQKIVAGTNNFTLLAIPFFLMAGKLMNVGSITSRIFNFASAFVGWIPGGLAHANVLGSIIFAGMSGSAVADAAGLGTIEIKAMEDAGFDTDFAASVTAASATIGPIIPPSIPLVMFGAVGGVSISGLLIGGIVPGLLMGITLSMMCYYFAKKRNYPKSDFPTVKVLKKTFKEAFLALMTPVILIGGILSGIFTATEAAAVASLYSIILTAVIYKEITWKDFLQVLRETVTETAAIMLIVGASTVFGYLMMKMQIPNMIINLVAKTSTNRYAFFLLLNLFLLVVGCFMETNAAILILTPILIPCANALGIDPVQLGLVVVLNLMIGLLTPPVGMCLYATAGAAHISFERVVKAVLPFYIPLFVVLFLITVFPQLVLWLPQMLK